MRHIRIDYDEYPDRAQYYIDDVYVATLWFGDDCLDIDYSNDDLPPIDEDELRREMHAERDEYHALLYGWI